MGNSAKVAVTKVHGIGYHRHIQLITNVLLGVSHGRGNDLPVCTLLPCFLIQCIQVTAWTADAGYLRIGSSASPVHDIRQCVQKQRISFFRECIARSPPAKARMHLYRKTAYLNLTRGFHGMIAKYFIHRTACLDGCLSAGPHPAFGGVEAPSPACGSPHAVPDPASHVRCMA